MIGTNDGTFWGTNSGNVQTWHTIYQAELAWLAMPARAKVLGQNTAGVAYGGSGGSHWTASSVLGGALSEQTQTLGDTATVSVWGRCVYVAYGVDSLTAGGAFTITVDGTGYGTFYSQGAGQTASIPARLGATHGSALARICGLSLTTHTVVVAVTSATSASNVVWLDWVGQPTGSQFATGPTVLAASPPRNFSSSGDANIQPYTAYVQQDVAALAADGLNIGYVETAGYLVAPADFYYVTLANAAISGSTLTFSSATGVAVAATQNVYGPGVAASTSISSGSGTTWTLNNSQTVAATTLYLGDGTHPNDAGHRHLRDAFVAALNTQFSAKGKSAASAQASPLLAIVNGCGSYLNQTPTQGNVILGGGFASSGVCSANYMLNSGWNNAIGGGESNHIGAGGTGNTNNNFLGAGTVNTIQFGGANALAAGSLNSVQGFDNFLGAGIYNSVFGTASAAAAGEYGNDRSRTGVNVWGSAAFATSGADQRVEGTLGAYGASTTPICVTTNGSAAGSANEMNLAANTDAAVTIIAHARDATTAAKNYTALWSAAHTLAVGSSYPASITLDGASSAVSPDSIKSAGTVTGASFAALPDASNGGILVCFTPPTGNTDTWRVGAAITQLEIQ